jgi:hypothetical protein
MNKVIIQSIIVCFLTNVLSVFSTVFQEETFFVLIELLTVIAGTLSLLALAKNPIFRFNFFLLSSPIVLLGSGLGILNTYISIEVFTDDNWNNILINSNVELSDIIYGQIYVNNFSAIFSICGLVLNTIGIIDDIYKKVKASFEETRFELSIFIFLLTGVQLYLIIGGYIIFGGTGIQGIERESHPLIGLAALYNIVPMWCGYYLQKNRGNLNIIRVSIFLSIFTTSLYYFFTSGRRMILFFFLLFAIGFWVDKPITYSYLKKNSITIALTLLFVWQAASVYNQFRMLKGYDYIQENGIISSIINLDDNEDFKKDNLSNISIRSSYGSTTLAFFVNIVNRYDRHLNGTVFLNSFWTATPSDWFVNKTDVPIQEALYQREYPIKIGDLSDSVCLEALIDFGGFGVLIYPFLYYVILLLFYKTTNLNSPFYGFVVAAVLCHLALSMIESGTGQLFLAIRVAVLGFPVAKIVQVFAQKATLKRLSNSTIV